MWTTSMVHTRGAELHPLVIRVSDRVYVYPHSRSARQGRHCDLPHPCHIYAASLALRQDWLRSSRLALTRGRRVLSEEVRVKLEGSTNNSTAVVAAAVVAVAAAAAGLEVDILCDLDCIVVALGGCRSFAQMSRTLCHLDLASSGEVDSTIDVNSVQKFLARCTFYYIHRWMEKRTCTERKMCRLHDSGFASSLDLIRHSRVGCHCRDLETMAKPAVGDTERPPETAGG